MAVSREIVEGTQRQGSDEQVYYNLTTTPWGSDPSSVAVKAYSLPDLTDVTETVLSGAASVTGDVITLPVCKSLTAGTTYRIEVKFTCSSNVFEAYALILAER